jgi:hypothetical protein
MAKILTKNSFTSGVTPAGLSAGELAVNVSDKKLFVGNVVGGVVTLHDQNNVVTSVNGATGAVVLTGLTASQVLIGSSNVNATRYLTFVGGSGTTGLFIDDVTTPLTYTPQGGAIGAKKVTLTTSANVLTMDSATPNVTLTDGVNVSTFGIDSFAAAYVSGKFTVSNDIGITLSVGTVNGQGLGIESYSGSFSYELPIINGKSGQAVVWPSSGSGLTWSDMVTSVNGATGAVTIASGLSWSAVTADRSLVAEEGVLANKSSGTLTLTLPSTAALGKIIRVSGMQNTWRIAQNASQKIHFGKTTTTTGVGGYLESSNAKDSVELVCSVANLEWNVISSIGNITIV